MNIAWKCTTKLCVMGIKLFNILATGQMSMSKGVLVVSVLGL